MTAPTQEQNKIISHSQGPAIVIAGAGTGKTFTICEYVANLISQGKNPNEIMMLTFTNDAAKEMRHRIANKVGIETAKKIIAGTFHATAVRMLRLYGWNHTQTQEDGSKIQIKTRDFKVLSAADDIDNIAIVRGQFQENLHNAGVENSQFPQASKIADIISAYKNYELANITDVLDWNRYARYCSRQNKILLTQFYNTYEQYKQDHNLLSFDDLIEYWIKLINDKPNICTTISHIVVDEAQDMNDRQHTLIDTITQHMQPENIMLVGDAAQSIYGWRGSDVHAFDDFSLRHPGTKIYSLSINFRSKQPILDFANQIMTHAAIKNKTSLVAGRKDYTSLSATGSVKQEDLCTSDKNINVIFDELRNKKSFETIAVIGRHIQELREIEKHLIQNRIAYEFHGGQKFNELRCVRDVITMLQMSFNEANVTPAEVARIMNMYDQVGERTSSDIAQIAFPDCLMKNPYSKKKGMRAEAIREMCQDLIVTRVNVGSHTNWPESVRIACNWYIETYKNEKTKANKKNKKRDFSELEDELRTEIKSICEHLDMLEMIANNSSSLQQLTDEMALESPRIIDDEPQLILTTIHSAKGLEWDKVILLNFVDEVFPGELQQTGYHKIDEKSEEERRCLYVAITRARDKLIVTVPRKILWNGQLMATSQCRFIKN